MRCPVLFTANNNTKEMTNTSDPVLLGNSSRFSREICLTEILPVFRVKNLYGKNMKVKLEKS